MPSVRKRIGYLPSAYIQEVITNISTKENLSQSKVVGILVEEALIARSGLYHQRSNDLIRKNLYCKEKIINNSSFNYNELDVLISDKSITYNTKRYNYCSDGNLSDTKEKFNEELFEQFKQFILFQKMTQDK